MSNCNRCAADLASGEVNIYTFESEELKLKETICRKCADTERLILFQRSGRMTANLIVSAMLQRMEEEHGSAVPSHVLAIPIADQRKLLRANKRMYTAIKEFEREVWFKGLQEYIRTAEWKGHSATSSFGLKVMIYAIAGKVMITLEDEKEGVGVTLITTETEASPVMRMQGVDGRVFDAIRLMKEAQRHFQHGRLQFTPDKQVGVI